MYRALYNFASEDVGTLSFQKGDKFTLIDCSIDENWWHVVDVHGQAGYVPVQYLEKDQVVSLAYSLGLFCSVFIMIFKNKTYRP